MKNKKILLSIVLIIVVAIIVAIIVALIIFNKNSSKENDKLVMVTEAGFAPYEFYEGEEVVGVDVEIAKKIAEKMGKTNGKMTYKITRKIINEIKTGKADFGAAGLSITPERLEEVDFSIEYATSKQVIVVKKDSSINGPDDLKGKKVAVQLGTIADLTLSEETEIELVQHKKYLLAVEDLMAGKVDAIVMDSLPAAEIIKENSGLKITDEELLTDKYGIAVKKGNTELLNTINEVLQELMEEGKIEEFTIKYLGE